VDLWFHTFSLLFLIIISPPARLGTFILAPCLLLVFVCDIIRLPTFHFTSNGHVSRLQAGKETVKETGEKSSFHAFLAFSQLRFSISSHSSCATLPINTISVASFKGTEIGVTGNIAKGAFKPNLPS
jgi:hypothetical protein